jgi:N4-gp56 family major capsid protein
MSVITSSLSGITNQYQTYFSKKLLEHAVQAVVLNQFATQADLPKKQGAKTMSLFRRSASENNSSGLVAAVQTLGEGSPITSFANHTYEKVDVTLVQYGEAAKITDITTFTELFDALKDVIGLMGEDCALHADNITRNAIIADATAKMYAQGAANFAALAAAGVSAGKITAVDILDAVTKLKINRAPTFGGYYVAILPPQVGRDIQNDPDWQEVMNYGDPNTRFKGELGRYAGARFVEHTNPFCEDADGSEGAYAVAATAAKRIYRTLVVGKDAYGTPKLAGDSPSSPKIVICDKPDKSDPLNQFITAGWKAFWAAKLFNANWAVSVSSKTEYAG